MSELFIVGAQRSGTTYLYGLLDSHPAIYMAKPVRPEPKFFLDEKNVIKGKSYYENLYYSMKRSDVDYIGEKSTSYVESEFAAKNIKKFYPDARIIFILREPVARAYSNYQFSVSNGMEVLGFSEAIEKENERLSENNYASSVNPFAYVKRGYYINYIEKYAEIFHKDNIYVLIYEELISNLMELKNLYEWLGVDSSVEIEPYLPIVNSCKYSPINNNESSTFIKSLHEIFYQSNLDLERYLGREIKSWKVV